MSLKGQDLCSLVPASGYLQFNNMFNDLNRHKAERCFANFTGVSRGAMLRAPVELGSSFAEVQRKKMVSTMFSAGRRKLHAGRVRSPKSIARQTHERCLS
jgi:hypothetical protein